MSNLPQNLAQFRKKTKKASCQKFVVSSSINKNLAPKSGFRKVWKILLLNLYQKNYFFLHEPSRTIMVVWQKYWKLDPFQLLKTFNTIYYQEVPNCFGWLELWYRCYHLLFFHWELIGYGTKITFQTTGNTIQVQFQPIFFQKVLNTHIVILVHFNIKE